MLGKALKESREEQAASLLRSQVDTERPEDYGAVSADPSTVDEENSLVNSYTDDEDEEDSDDESDAPIEEEKDQKFHEKIWRSIRNCFRVVANVENLWDESPKIHSSDAQRREMRRRNHTIVLFWFVVLASSYAGERSTYKLLVDLSGPFRIFAVEMVTATHAIILGISMIIGHFLGYGTRLPLGIPVVDVALMAVLDTMNILLVFLTGYHVAPTLSVILVQFTLPLTVFLTQFVHPKGRCSFFPNTADDTEANGEQASPGNEARVPPPPRNDGYERIRRTPSLSTEEPLQHWGGLSTTHIWGSLILSAAVLISLIPSFYSIINPGFFMYADTVPMRTAANTLLYVCACIPAAASQLYKEHVFLQYKQPVNMDLLNLLLSIFTFIFASIMSPLLFGLQGLGESGDWTKLYPSEDFSENFSDGVKCFLNVLDRDDQLNKYPDDARCECTFALTIMYAISIIGVGVAVDKIVNAGATKVMYRGISAGIIVAVLSMYWYDLNIPYFSYGPIVDSLNLISLILLVLGSEVYHRVMIHESSFETIYATLENIYDDE